MSKDRISDKIFKNRSKGFHVTKSEVEFEIDYLYGKHQTIMKGDIVIWYGNDEFFGYLGEITNANSDTIDIYLGNHCNLRLICKRQQFKDIQVIDHIGE